MKNQRMKTNQSTVFSMMLVVLTVVVLIGCFAVTTFAANGNVAVDLGTDLNIGLTMGSDGIYCKEYDGTTSANVTAKAPNVTVVSASFDSADVATATKVVIQLTKDGENATVEIPAKITPKTLTWGSGTATATSPYLANTTLYSGLAVSNLPDLYNGTAKVDGAIVGNVTVDVNAATAGTYTAQAAVTLTPNYRVAPLTVQVTITPVTLTEIEWVGITGGEYRFAFGDAAASKIVAIGKTADGNEYPLVINYPEGYGNVTANGHRIQATSPDATNVALGQVDPYATVNFTPATYTVSMKDATVAGTKDTHEAATKFFLAVEGDMPASVRALIAYTANGSAFNGAEDYGTYAVTATLPTSENFKFVDAAGNEVTTLNATLTIARKYIIAKTADGTFQIVLVGTTGITGEGNITVPEVNRKAIKGFPVYKSYTLNLTNVEGTYSILIPIEDGLYHKRCEALTADDIYLYDAATGTKVKVSEENGCTVTVKEGYIQIDGLTGSRTFVIAPEYNQPFWLTPLGIALLVLMILAILVLLFYIGLTKRRILAQENAATVIDTEGDVPAVEPVVIEDKVDVDEAIEETLDQVEETLEAEVAAEEEPEAESTEGLEEAVAESIEEVVEEASQITLEEEPEAATEEMADAIAEELADTEAEAEPEAEADEDALRNAVAAALADNFNESADAEDAVVLADSMSSESFRGVVEAIVADAMKATMYIPEETEDAEAEAAEADENADIAAVVVDCIEIAFGKLINRGVEPAAVEGTTAETIVEAVEQAGDANIPEGWINELANTVKGAIADELIARLLVVEEEVVEEAPVEEEAVEAIAVVEEPATEAEDDDNDNDNDDDDDDGFSFGGFGGMNLHFIDVKAEPETYAEMQAQESRGEVRLVYRYRRSFESRLIQSQGSVQDYYSAIKNALLAHKGVKNRISWNYEAFNRGRTHVAKINAKTKTLYLYLALDPEELADTKYGIIDVSSKKKYASVPVLMKIKGERKFKYALELIDKLCQEKLELPKLEIEDVDYRKAYQTTEEMVETGEVKMLAASIPESYFAEQEAETEAPAEETGNQEV